MSQSKQPSESKPPEKGEPVVAPGEAPVQDAAQAAPAEKTAEPQVLVTPDSLRAAEEERDACKERYARLAAEYDNFRKRSAREREALYADIKAETVTAFLSVYDNLERALSQPTEDTAYAQGVELIQKGLLDVFGKLGVIKMEALGAAFDPNVHNAVMHIEDETLEKSTVAEVFSQGFMMGDKAIRPAVVKVAN